MVVGFSSLADALPPWLVMRVDALPPLLGRRPLHLDVVVSASRFSGWILVRGIGCALCLLCFCSAVVRVIVVFPRLCVCFFNVSLFLVLCALMLVNLYLTASRLCL